MHLRVRRLVPEWSNAIPLRHLIRLSMTGPEWTFFEKQQSRLSSIPSHRPPLTALVSLATYSPMGLKLIGPLDKNGNN